jgi:hypothetical protein
VPAIGDLDGTGQRLCGGLAVTSATVARNDFDLRTSGEPGSHRCDLAIRKQRYDPPSLQIAHDGSVTVILPESPVINAGDSQRTGSWAGSSADDPQQGVVAHGQHQPLGETRRRSAAERQAQMMDDIFQPCRPARPGWENIVAEPLGENTSPAIRHPTDKTARDHPKAHLLASAGQVRNMSDVTTVDSPRCHPAQRASGHVRLGSNHQFNRVR